MEAPRDARAIAAILKGMQVDKYDSEVVHMLLEILHAHITDLLLSARVVTDHAGKVEIDFRDLQLAAESHRALYEPPPRDAVLALARERNATVLPPLRWPSSAFESIPLPSPEHILTPQQAVDVEMPPVRGSRATAPEGPWVLRKDAQRS